MWKQKSKFRRWLERSISCKFGFHVFSWKEWSVDCNNLNGTAFFHCEDCQKTIKEIPFDDIPQEIRNNIFGGIHLFASK